MTATVDGPIYDGFILYSHAADDLLAPRLQAGLQRFAKPWWKRRVVRVFRDESSLSANPHLWSSITEALDSSAWFVLLLSPDVAFSEWVNQEIDYWKTHKDPTRILHVPSDAMWIDESTLGIIQRSGEWVVVPLDDAALLERASAVVTRSFIPEECRQYEIEPCPTLDEIRGR